MNFLTIYLLILAATFAYAHVMLRFIQSWVNEDRVLRQCLAGVVSVNGRILIRDDKGANVMYYDDFYTLPYRREDGRMQ